MKIDKPNVIKEQPSAEDISNAELNLRDDNPVTREIIAAQLNLQFKILSFAKNLPDKLLIPIETSAATPENFRQAMKDLDAITTEINKVKEAIGKTCSEYFGVVYSPWAQGPFCAREREGEARLVRSAPHGKMVPASTKVDEDIAPEGSFEKTVSDLCNPVTRIASELCDFFMSRYKGIYGLPELEHAILEVHKDWVTEDLIPAYMDAVDDANPDKPASRDFRLAVVEDEIRESLDFSSRKYRDVQQILSDAAMEHFDKPGINEKDLDEALTLIETSLKGSTVESLDAAREMIVEIILNAVRDITNDIESEGVTELQ